MKRLLAAAGFPAGSIRVDVSGPTRGPKLVLVAASPAPPAPRTAAAAEVGREAGPLRGVRVEDKVDRIRLAQVRGGLMGQARGTRWGTGRSLSVSCARHGAGVYA